MQNFFKSFLKFFRGNQRRTKVNLTEVYPRGKLRDTTKSELKLLVYLISREAIKKGPRYPKGEERDIEIDREVGIENQTEHLTYDALKEDFPSKSEFNEARKILLEKGIISESPKRGYYYVNAYLINHNYSHQNDALMITDTTKYK